MRIIAGEYRGLRLRTLKSGKLRPTSDQLRETLFDVLGIGVAGATFLDAYAGSGAVGIEALSRGASKVTFIEQSRAIAEVIRENLMRLGIKSGFQILTTQAQTGIERLSQDGARFDYLFLDPPYDEIAEYHRILREIQRSSLLEASSLVIAEHSRHCILESQYGNLARIRLLRHGDSQLAFYRLGAPRL